MTTMTRISLLLMVVFFLAAAAQAETVTFNEGDTASKIAASHFGDFHQASNYRFAHKASGKVFQSTNLNDLQWRQMPDGEYEVTRLTTTYAATTDNQPKEVVRPARTPRITSTVKNQVRATPLPPSSRNSNRSYGNPEKTQDEEDAELTKLNIINSQTGKKMTVAEIKQQITYACDGLARSAGIGSLSFPCKNFRVQRTFTAMDPDSTPPDEDAKHKARMAKMVMGVGISLCLLVILIVTGLLLHQWHERVVRQKEYKAASQKGREEAAARAARKITQQLTAQELREIQLARFMSQPNGDIDLWNSFGKLASDLLLSKFPQLKLENTPVSANPSLNCFKLFPLEHGLQVEICSDDQTVGLVGEVLDNIYPDHACENMGEKDDITAFFILYRADFEHLRAPLQAAPVEDWATVVSRFATSTDSEMMYKWSGMANVANYMLGSDRTKITTHPNGVEIEIPEVRDLQDHNLIRTIADRSPVRCRVVTLEPENGLCCYLILPDNGKLGNAPTQNIISLAIAPAAS